MSARHAAVWIDRNDTKVFHFDGGTFEASTMAPRHHVHRHPRGSLEKKEHPADVKHFFESVAKALADAEERTSSPPYEPGLQVT